MARIGFKPALALFVAVCAFFFRADLTIAAAATGASTPSGNADSALPAKAVPAGDVVTGTYVNARMSIEVFLAPRNPAQLAALLAKLYDPDDPAYEQWLAKGRFAALFAPTAAQQAAVAAYLRARGLGIEPSTSPFIVRAAGSSSAIGAAFRTTIRTYRASRGAPYFANASAMQLPRALAAGVLAVVGLSDTVRPHSHLRRAPRFRSASRSSTAGCESPYPTRFQFFAYANWGSPFGDGYGAGPGCSGLSPAQINAIYGAPNLGAGAQGAGVLLGLFELSAYQPSDIAAFARQFFGGARQPPLANIIVDGGPLRPICPASDACQPPQYAYFGDDEVDADIEMQLAIAPAASYILVYDAPADATGQTSLDEYAQMASDDLADVISTSWGDCEDADGAAYERAENVIFEQMALQGQSVFSATGDDGAFGCLGDFVPPAVTGPTLLNVGDPAGQPWVTGVGGTSLESFNPGANPAPAYPAGVETVWNSYNLCNSGPNEGGVDGNDLNGYFWCLETGAGNGANSEFFGRPFYQFGPDVTSRYTVYGNGTTRCSFVAVGTPCREVPDVSADADEYTGYAEYCSGTATTTPGGACVGSYSGWSGAGGTSLSSPLWSAIFADRDSYLGKRSGNANPLLYRWYRQDPSGYFHDVNGFHLENDNGYFPATPGYDIATGLGTPKMSAIITGVPQN